MTTVDLSKAIEGLCCEAWLYQAQTGDRWPPIEDKECS
jgi:hypothetical protein